MICHLVSCVIWSVLVSSCGWSLVLIPEICRAHLPLEILAHCPIQLYKVVIHIRNNWSLRQIILGQHPKWGRDALIYNIAASKLYIDYACYLIWVENKRAIPLMIFNPEWHLVSFICARVVISFPSPHSITAAEISGDWDLIDVSLTHNWLDIVNII